MRIFVLLFIFMMPALAICSATYAKSPTEIGKPVCAHFDDNAKSAPRASTSTEAAATTTAIATNANPSIPGGAAPAQPKGGASGFARPHNAPRWQTFLPGMFK